MTPLGMFEVQGFGVERVFNLKPGSKRRLGFRV